MKIKHFLFIFLSLFFTHSSCQSSEAPSDEQTDTAGEEQQAMGNTTIDTIPYERIGFVDSLLAEPGEEDSPRALYQESYIMPQPEDPALKRFLQDSILHDMAWEGSMAKVSSPREAFDLNKQQFFAEFMEVLKEVDRLMGYEYDLNSNVYYNSRGYFTLGYTFFTYTGGAHGNYGTTLVTYDLKNKNRLRKNDVFKAGFEEKLLPILEKKVRERFELEPGQSLSVVLFEEDLPLTDNFGLTEEGILFNYPPYEVAAYAAGEIELLVTYEEVKDVLKINL